MSDLIFTTNGEETFRISPPTVGTKCPETKLEVKKMTEIEKVRGEIKVLEKKLALLESIENYKSPVEKAYRDAYGKYPEPGFSAGDWDAVSWTSFQKGYDAAQKQKTGEDISKVLIEGDVAYIMGVKYQRVEEPYCPDEPEYYDEVEWDEKDNPKPMNEVVDRLIKKYQAQKLWNRVRDELGYSIDCCDEIVNLVEKWLPKEQSAAGSQNVDTELLVDGFNDCVRKMKEMLR
jgi:hypothetical protein